MSGPSADGRLGRDARRLLALAAALLVACAMAPTAGAEGHPVATQSESSADEGASPPPGTMGREGVVPKEGAAAEGAPGAPAAPPLEPIGHVPGPDEGVYGDPPNTGGTIDPETRGWAYDTGYLFALTRGLSTDTDLGAGGRRWVRPLTITMDVVTLPTAALAGLSGTAPADDEPDDAASTGEPATGEPTPAQDEAEGFMSAPDEASDS